MEVHMRWFRIYTSVPASIVIAALFGCSGVGGSSDVTLLDVPGKDVPLLEDASEPDLQIDSNVPPDDKGVEPDDISIHDNFLPDPGFDDQGTPDPGAQDPGQKDLSPGDMTKPDIQPVKNPVFRVEMLEVVEPGFCLQSSPGSPCTEVTDIVNDFIATSISNPENPLNLLLRFVPFEIGGYDTGLLVGPGTCVFEGDAPTGCAFSAAEKPVLFNGPLFKEGGCKVGPGRENLPCFETKQKKVEMYFMDIFLALHKAIVSGTVDMTALGWRIEPGGIVGFVPVNTTKSIQVALPGGMSLLLYDLLKHNPVDKVNGVSGFWFHFNYKADTVEYLE